MKTRFILTSRNLLTGLAAAVLMLTACSKDDDTPQATAPNNFEYQNFRQNQGLNLLGNAFITGDTLRLTKNDYYQESACWYGRSRVKVADGFETNFQFRISKRDTLFESVWNGTRWTKGPFLGYNGADGFTFVIQNAGVDSMGNYGYEKLGNSIAIEFDTFDNGATYGDPDGNHVSIHSMGTAPNTMNESASKNFGGPVRLGLKGFSDISDGKVYKVKITYQSAMLTVFMNDKEVHKAPNVDLNTLLKLTEGAAYVGFTSFTGAAYENHDIMSWSFKPLQK